MKLNEIMDIEVFGEDGEVTTVGELMAESLKDFNDRVEGIMTDLRNLRDNQEAVPCTEEKCVCGYFDSILDEMKELVGMMSVTGGGWDGEDKTRDLRIEHARVLKEVRDIEYANLLKEMRTPDLFTDEEYEAMRTRLDEIEEELSGVKAKGTCHQWT